MMFDFSAGHGAMMNQSDLDPFAYYRPLECETSFYGGVRADAAHRRRRYRLVSNCGIDGATLGLVRGLKGDTRRPTASRSLAARLLSVRKENAMLPSFVRKRVPKSAPATVMAIPRYDMRVLLRPQKEADFFHTDERLANVPEWCLVTHFDGVTDYRIIGNVSIEYANGIVCNAHGRTGDALKTGNQILLTFLEPVVRSLLQDRMAQHKGEFKQLDSATEIKGALAAGHADSEADRLHALNGVYYANAADMDVFRKCKDVTHSHFFTLIMEAWFCNTTDTVLIVLTNELAAAFQREADRWFVVLGGETKAFKPRAARDVPMTDYSHLRRALPPPYASVGPLRRVLSAPCLDHLRKSLGKRFLSLNYVKNTPLDSPDPSNVVWIYGHMEPQITRLDSALCRDLSVWRSGRTQTQPSTRP